jgi:Predicted methyltransferase regulatory domain
VQAHVMLERPPEVLFHDELGGIFAPQSLESVANAAAAVGLRFLNDAGVMRTTNGFWDEGLSEADGVAREQASDYTGMTFFRQTLLVRAHHLPCRQQQIDLVDALYATGEFVDAGDGALKSGESEFTLRDDALTAHLKAISAAAPRHVPLASLGLDADQKEAFLHLFDLDLLHLRTRPPQFAETAGARPCASPLVRAHLADGQQRVVTLDHSIMTIDDPAAKTLLEHLDGTHDRAALQALWDTLDHPPELSLDGALAMLSTARLLVA